MIWLALLCALAAQEPDRANIDHGPWQWPVYPTVIQQSYGQATEKVCTTCSQEIHLGLDVNGAPGTSVYAPFAGTVEAIITGAGTGYGSEVVLLPKVGGTGWRVRLLHLTNLSVWLGKQVLTGERIGRVAAWPGNPGKAHAHLEVYQPEFKDSEALANPLAFLVNRPDALYPKFHDITDSTGKVFYGVVFTKNVDGISGPLEGLPYPLDAGQVDILVSVTDLVGHTPYVVGSLKPQAPARVSVSIWKMPHVWDSFGLQWGPWEVFSNSIDLRNKVPAATLIYSKSSEASSTFKLADYHFVLTNKLSELSYGTWNAKPGLHAMTVTAEDLAGNASFVSLWFTVK